MTTFYEQLEEPIRELVQRLRDNGINTTCSCGHEMYIQADLSVGGQMKDIHDTVFNWLVEVKRQKLMNYTITTTLNVTNGVLMHCWTEVRISPETQ